MSLTKSLASRVPVLDVLSSRTLDRVLARMESRRLGRKDVLWARGEVAPGLVWVQSGLVKEVQPVSGSRDLTLWLRGRGELLGEVAALGASLGGKERCHTTAIACEESRVSVLPTAALQTMMREDPALTQELGRIAADRRRALEGRLPTLLFKTAHARLASLFIDLSARFGVRDARGVILNLKLTHKEMASLIGATRETVSFAILDLRKDGLVHTEGKRVVLLDPDGLRGLAAA